MRVPCLLLLAATPLLAQEPVEVRRALPANSVDLDNYPNPVWVDQVQPQIRRAEPVHPVQNLAPAPIAVPVAEPIPVATPIPLAPTQILQPTPTPAPAAEVPAPANDAAGEALARANNFYAHKMPELAIPEYEKFLVLRTSGAGRDEALFRLAESHRLAANPAAARVGYEKLVNEFQSGEFAAAGAFRLGEILYAEKFYEPASIQFDLAAREAKEPGIRLASAYFAARGLDALERLDSAEDRYRAVLQQTTDNPYLENAAMALGALQLRRGKNQAALTTYETLSQIAGSPDVSASAALQAARLAKESGANDKSFALYEAAIQKSPDAKIKSEALVESLRLRFAAKDFEGVIKIAPAAEQSIDPGARAEIIQILAASLRQAGRENEARQAYDRLLTEHPGSASPEILYQRLLTLYALKDPLLPAEADKFLQTSADPKPKAAVSLLKAESLFQRNDYAAAAKAYEPILANSWLTNEQRTTALYKYAWSLAVAGDSAGAVQAYTEFLAKNPNDKLASGALLQRGLARQKMKAYPEAVADFDLLLKDYSMSKDVEIALLQKALTLGTLNKFPEMAAVFRELLAKYPNSAAAAQANYWIGWEASERKIHKEAVPYLDHARTLDSKNYGERASLRIILSYYQLEDLKSLSAEVDRYQGAPLPPQVLAWLSQGLIEERQFAKAAKILQPLADNSSTATPDIWILLSEARLGLGDFTGAGQAADKFLTLATTPPAQARGHIAKARSEAGLQRFPAARQAVDQALFLQPEGRFNSEARIASGDIYFAEGDYDSAARAFLSVSVLSDDQKLAPKALSRAAESYERANNSVEADKALKELAERFPTYRRDS
jgi:tetratricopeptide (TPR) repeat protein